DLGARVHHVCENAGGAAEDAFLESHALIDRDVVLDLALIADVDIRTGHDVLSKRAAAANARARQDMAEMPDLRPLADVAAVIDNSARVNLDAPEALRLGGRNRGQRLTQRGARLCEHAKHAHALVAIRPRPTAGGDAIEEVLTFESQGFALGHRDRLFLAPLRYRQTLAPFDAMRIEQQLARPGLAVIKHRHRPVADDNELLLLKRVQPGDEHMRLFTTGEGE